MSETLYLHVGTRKSGTTSIQITARSSPEQLAEQGVGLPWGAVGDRGQIADVLKSLEQQGAARAETQLRALRTKVEELPLPRSFFSAEALARLPGPKTRRFLEAMEGLDTHVIITARDLARQIPSDWQQDAKTGRAPSYPVFCRHLQDDRGFVSKRFRNRFDIPAIARKWGRGLPPENVHIIVLPQSGGDPTWLPRVFFGLMDVDADTLEIPPNALNRAMPYAEAELLRRVVKDLRQRRDDFRTPDLMWVIRKKWELPEGLPKRRIALPAPMLGWCEEESGRQVEAIRSAGWDVIGDLEDLRVTDDAAVFRPKGLLPADLDRIVGERSRYLESELVRRQRSHRVHRRAARAVVSGTQRVVQRGRSPESR